MDDITLDFSKNDGLIPVIVQSVHTKEVLMLAYMNEEALIETKESGFATFYSRSRKSLWKKGETSGNLLQVKSMSVDCDSDTILILADPLGPACHTGETSCFFRDILTVEKEKVTSEKMFSLFRLESIIQARKIDAEESSYTRSLFEKGINKIAQKVGEEATEVVIAALAESEEKFLEESADLLFHFLVLLVEKGLELKDVECVLSQRHRGKVA